MDEQFALWLTVIMTGVLLVGVTWILTDRIVELRHRVNKLEINRRLDEDWINGIEKGFRDGAKREWVGLTDDELKSLCDEWQIIYGGYVRPFARAIEAKLKEKNT